MKRAEIRRIASIIGSRPLATALYDSLESALRRRRLHVVGDRSPWGVFTRSLDTAIRKISNGPGSELFQRLLSHVPVVEDYPAGAADGWQPVMSDEEYASCVEFIYSHMVNRFKGELAELLALNPFAMLVDDLKAQGRIPKRAELYWGDTIAERRRRMGNGETGPVWTGFAKGADGLVVEKVDGGGGRQYLRIHAVVEVKSMRRGPRTLKRQVDRHITRLGGGLRLAGRQWQPDNLVLGRGLPQFSRPLGIVVHPSRWPLSREWRSIKAGAGRKIVFRETLRPPEPTLTEAIGADLWRITLSWSQEALEQAAYEMTFWYMSQVGGRVFAGGRLPRGWEKMQPERAGYNAIQMVLYFILLRPLDERRARLATRLYNVYCFGYQAGKDNRDMLWPSDFPHTRESKRSKG